MGRRKVVGEQHAGVRRVVDRRGVDATDIAQGPQRARRIAAERLLGTTGRCHARGRTGAQEGAVVLDLVVVERKRWSALGGDRRGRQRLPRLVPEERHLRALDGTHVALQPVADHDAGEACGDIDQLHPTHLHLRSRERERERRHASKADCLGTEPPGTAARCSQLEMPELIGERAHRCGAGGIEQRDHGSGDRDRVSGDDGAAHALSGERQQGRGGEQHQRQ